MENNKSINNLSFEDALDQLKGIVSKMENGHLSLEEMVKHYSTGKELYNKCKNELKNFEQKIEKLDKETKEITEYNPN